MVWHGTQCCVLPGMSKVAVVQWHHPQSHSSFPTPFAQCPELAEHPNTNTLAEACNNTGFDTHVIAPHTQEGLVDGLTLTTVNETSHHTHFHSIQPVTRPFLFQSSLSTQNPQATVWQSSFLSLKLLRMLEYQLLRLQKPANYNHETSVIETR